MPYTPSTAHASLGEGFFDAVSPASFPCATLRYRNQRWAERIGLGGLDDAAFAAHFARFTPLPDNLPQPLALRYHGHQFQHYNPDIGDGRGFLFAQVLDADGRLLDLATKGSGQTPYSRFGDGRLTLKGGVREVLAASLLEALGVNTSKALSLFETGESLMRDDEPSPTRSSVLVRLGHSHIRIGTFQRLSHEGDTARIAQLVEHCVNHYYPQARHSDTAEQTALFLECVCEAVARTGAQWMAAGFAHGVLNTDNTVITGESFDYGPYRFLPHYDPAFTAAYFDGFGMYAFARQPSALQWNLDRLADCLVPLCGKARLERALHRYDAAFMPFLYDAVCARLGVAREDDEHCARLVQTLYGFLLNSRAPFEQVFFDWRGGSARLAKALDGPAGDHYQGEAFHNFLGVLDSFFVAHEDAALHPYFARIKPVTLIYDEIEALWAPIAAADDWSAFDEKITEIAVIRSAYGII